MDIKTKTFIDKVRAKNHANHKDANGDWLYSYDKVKYITSLIKVIITCKHHGDFKQTPGNHGQGVGCPACGVEARATKRRGNSNQFVIKANKIHSNLYNYDKVNYINNSTKIIITCKTHGDFKQIPYHHLLGSGCNKCSIASHIIRRTKSIEDFIVESNLVHNSTYSYAKTDYKNTHVKVVISCKHHGDFEQTPNRHLQGHGCPECGRLSGGWTRSIFRAKCEKNNKGLGILYVIRCFKGKETFYKIGITSRSIEMRYKGSYEMPYNYEIIHEFVFDPDTVYDLENDIFRVMGDYKYEPLISFGGQTECFSSIDYLESYFEYLSELQ